MLTTETLTREELAELVPYRLAESAILGAKAAVARRRADRAGANWRRALDHSTRLMRLARQQGETDHFAGKAFLERLSVAHAQHGYARTLERIYLRAESEAQYWTRAATRQRVRERQREAQR